MIPRLYHDLGILTIRRDYPLKMARRKKEDYQDDTEHKQDDTIRV